MHFDIKSILVTVFISFFSFAASAQADTAKPYKIAVLAPLYLDSAFDGYTYKLSETSIPQYILAGLDFYNGVMLAIDSLQKENADLRVSIIDTKKKGTTINSILNEMNYANYSLIIASFNNTKEQQQVAEFSFSHNIPVISVTYPNDGNVTQNPFFVILNSTLKTHINGIYHFVKNNYTGSKIVFVTKKGYLENKIQNDFKANDTGTVKLKYRTVELTNTLELKNLFSALDSTKHNVIICGSLEENFGMNILQATSAATAFNSTIIGMPNWDGFKDLDKAEHNNVEIIYSTPFNYSRTDSFGTKLIETYRSNFYARPSDMVFKGFEGMYHFTHLLMKYGKGIINHLSDSSYKVENDFLIRPVKLAKQSFIPDYLENKNLYFIKKLAGEITSIVQLNHP